VFTDAEGPIEEVEVVDISRNPPPTPSLGWMPAAPLANLEAQAAGMLRRRKST
jgi:hypothetical protein